MNIKELLKLHAYSCCLHWLLLVGILKILNQSYGLGVKDVFILLLPALWAILIRSFDQNKKNFIPYVMIVFIAVILFIVVQVTHYPILRETSRYFNWLKEVLYGNIQESFPYSLLTIFVFLFVISLPCYILLKRYTLRMAVAVVLFVVLIVVTVANQGISKLSVSFFLTFILLSVMEGRINSFYHASKNGSINTMTFLLPFALLMTVTLLVLPTKKEPIQWQFFKSCWKNISNMVEGWGDDINLWLHPEKAEFGLSFTGYTEEGDIGGSLEEGDSIALTMELSSPLNSDVYLIGNTKNKFNGKEWSLINKEAPFLDAKDEFEYDLFELSYALKREGIMPDTYGDYYKPFNFTITYQDIVTNALFYPLKTQTIHNYNSSDDFQSKTDNIRFDGARDEGTKYKINYARINLGSQFMNQLIMNQSKYSYQEDHEIDQRDFESYLRQCNILSRPDVPKNFEALLCQRAAYIKENYTELYDGLPQRVYDLTTEITKDYESEYDKLLAIERYLSGFTYTTKPRQPENEQDIIDFMLFESHEGYCTYYATAFAVMARCINIPTRYVQGFCVEYEGQSDRYHYSVSSGDAHAWAEAYVEGIGWLPFEPTPTYGEKRYHPWTSSDHTSVSQYQPTMPVMYGDGVDDEAEAKIKELRTQEKKLAYRSVVIIVIVILVLLLLAVPLYLLTKQAYRNRLYRRAAINQKVYMDVHLLLSIFRYCDRRIEPYETFSTYMNYIRSRYLDRDKDLTYLEQVFLRLRYNEEELSKEEQEKVASIRDNVLREVHSILKRNKYLRMRIYLLQSGYSLK